MCINYLSCCGSKMPDKSHIRKRGFLLTSGSKVHSFMVGGSGSRSPRQLVPLNTSIRKQRVINTYAQRDLFFLFSTHIQYMYTFIQAMERYCPQFLCVSKLYLLVIYIIPHKHVREFVSLMILNSIKSAIMINHHNSSGTEVSINFPG